ncbi:MAG: peptidoglycan editing factor PgeF [Lachnospiraceae bacterium]|nr:peptidoglycan editing factor PgeF [Lachnospiraceae bacterium]
MKIITKNPYTGEVYHSEGETVLHEGKTPYLTFSAFESLPWIRHGFSTRLGGVSTGDCESMNLSFSRGDDPSCVEENFMCIASAIGFDIKDIVFSDQIHKTDLHVATKSDCAGEDLAKKKLEGIDGLLTDEPHVVLATSYADCVPLFFVDPTHKAIASSHSGWRGTVAKIGEKTVKAMTETFGSDPKDLIVVIGPSICTACYEVSEEVAEAFRKAYTADACGRFLYEKGNGKYQLDLWLACKIALIEAGVKEENVHISGACTCCNAKMLWSHRATKGRRGNMLGFLEKIELE